MQNTWFKNSRQSNTFEELVRFFRLCKLSWIKQFTWQFACKFFFTKTQSGTYIHFAPGLASLIVSLSLNCCRFIWRFWGLLLRYNYIIIIYNCKLYNFFMFNMVEISVSYVTIFHVQEPWPSAGREGTSFKFLKFVSHWV